MSNNIDQENPSANDNNTDATIVEAKMATFRARLAKYKVSSDIPNLSEKNEKFNGH